MQIKEINQGQKIPYALDIENKSISFDEELVVNLAERQSDVKKVIDISLNKQKKLIEGTAQWYVANLVIPAVEYNFVDTGEINENGESIMEKIKVPLNVDDVELVLWAMPTDYFNKEDGGVK
jgi:hypothetical protein